VKSRTLIFAANRFSRSVHDYVRISERRPVPVQVFGNASKVTELEPIKMRIERFAVQGGTYYEQYKRRNLP
jgi:hypothetical protein